MQYDPLLPYERQWVERHSPNDKVRLRGGTVLAHFKDARLHNLTGFALYEDRGYGDDPLIIWALNGHVLASRLGDSRHVWNKAAQKLQEVDWIDFDRLGFSGITDSIPRPTDGLRLVKVAPGMVACGSQRPRPTLTLVNGVSKPQP